MPHAPARPDRLPAYDTPFVGRVTELAQVARQLTRARLVTVTGPGGVGKTRLALRAAASAASGFRDGLCLVRLSALADPAMVPDEIAARLGLPERSSVTALDTVLDYLRGRELLLILDTCEHLLDVCAGLTETLLVAAESVTVLATSRQPLDVSGENICPLAPLPIPADDERPSPGDATDLFARLAAASTGAFAVTDANRAEVIRLCRRLDGIPLALELAAARLRTVPLADLAGPEAVPLTASPENADPGKADRRHESLDAAIAWSYDLCSRAEQALWQRFSVFADAVGFEAAEEVCADGDLPRGTLVETLIGLVDKSVLRRETTEGPARFRMLDTIREFGARRLAASGSQGLVMERLARRYLNLVRRLDEDILRDDQFAIYEQARREHASLNAALGWCLGSHERSFRKIDLDVVGVELVTKGFWFWVVGGLPREGLRWVDRVLGSPAVAGRERGRALAARCLLDSTAGQGPQSVVDGRECVAQADESGDRRTGARGCVFLVIALAMTQDFQGALEASAEAERRLAALDDRAGRGLLALAMTMLYAVSEDFPKGKEWYERGVRLIGPSRERALSGWLHLTGGYILLRLGEIDGSAAAWRLALRAKHDSEDIVGTAVTLEGFALMAVLTGRNTRATWLFGATQPLWDRAGAMLFNVEPLIDLHEQFREQVRTALGTRRFDALVRRGERSPLSRVAELAIADADELPAIAARDPSGPRLLTSREEEVAELASTGLSHREIATRMSVSKRTVDAHLEHIYAKLGVSSWQELAVWLTERE